MIDGSRENADTKRWNEIDVLYTLGTLLVVFGHSHSSDWNHLTGTILENIIMFIYTFHMPLFFFIAGFLFYNSVSFKKDGFLIYIKNKALRLLTPYAVLSVSAILPKYYIENGGFNGFSTYLVQAIFIPRVGVWGHFWFLPVLFLLYFIFGLWKIFVPDQKKYIGLTLAIISAIILYFLPNQTNWFGWNDLKDAMVFFVSGMILKQYMYNTKRISLDPYPLYIRFIGLILGVVGAIILFVIYQDTNIAILLCGIIMIFVCWQVASIIGVNKVCKWISKNNFTIYIYSWPFQTVMMVLADRFNLSLQLTVLCMFIIGMVGPIMLILIYMNMKVNKNYFFDLLLGVK